MMYKSAMLAALILTVRARDTLQMRRRLQQLTLRNVPDEDDAIGQKLRLANFKEQEEDVLWGEIPEDLKQEDLTNALSVVNGVEFHPYEKHFRVTLVEGSKGSSDHIEEGDNKLSPLEEAKNILMEKGVSDIEIKHGAKKWVAQKNPDGLCVNDNCSGKNPCTWCNSSCYLNPQRTFECCNERNQWRVANDLVEANKDSDATRPIILNNQKDHTECCKCCCCDKANMWGWTTLGFGAGNKLRKWVSTTATVLLTAGMVFVGRLATLAHLGHGKEDGAMNGTNENSAFDKMIIDGYQNWNGDVRDYNAITFRVENTNMDTETVDAYKTKLIRKFDLGENYFNVVGKKRVSNKYTELIINTEDLDPQKLRSLGVNEELIHKTKMVDDEDKGKGVYEQVLFDEEMEKFDKLPENEDGETIPAPLNIELAETLEKEDIATFEQEGINIVYDSETKTINLEEEDLLEAQVLLKGMGLSETEGDFIVNDGVATIPVRRQHDDLTMMGDELVDIKFDPSIDNCHREIDLAWTVGIAAGMFVLLLFCASVAIYECFCAKKGPIAQAEKGGALIQLQLSDLTTHQNNEL